MIIEWFRKRKKQRQEDAALRIIETESQAESERNAALSAWTESTPVENRAQENHAFFEGLLSELQRQEDIKRVLQIPLRDAALRAGLDIPDAYLTAPDILRRRILSSEGEARLRRDLADHRMSRAKDWLAIVMPILSLIASTLIAVLGLMVALKKK